MDGVEVALRATAVAVLATLGGVGAVGAWSSQRRHELHRALTLLLPVRGRSAAVSLRPRIVAATALAIVFFATAAVCLVVPAPVLGIVWWPPVLAVHAVRFWLGPRDPTTGPGPLPPGAPRTSSDPVQLQTPNWDEPHSRRP